MELTEAMRSQNACRYYKPDPVPLEVFHKAVDSARFAPQGGNRQPVRFLIVTDPEKKQQLGEWYRIPWKAYMESAAAEAGSMEADSGDEKATNLTMSNPQKGLADADHFADHFGEHPAVIIALAELEQTHPTDTDLGRLSVVGGASIYTMVQNLCLSLRNEGVATTVTTLLCLFEPQVKELLGIPEHLATCAHVVAGYPEKPFPTKLLRHPVETLAFVDSMDNPLTL